MTIRNATKDDMNQVLDLIKELAVFENEPNAVVLSVDDLIQDGFGNRPLFQTFVAEENNEIIGMALFYYRYSTWKGKTIHLEDLIVKENKRGLGAGFALYSQVMKQAKIDEVRRVEWAVLDWNSTAIDFYEKSGAKVLSDWRVAQMDENGINSFLSKL